MNLHLSEASKEHCDLLFNWTNDEEVRKNSFNSGRISYEEHVAWLNKKIMSNNSIVFICYSGDIPIGVARIEVEDYIGVISYSIDRQHRGKGIASEMLKLLEKKIKMDRKNIHALVGYVKFDNIPSQNIFKKLQYKEERNKEGYRYYKDI